MVHSLAPRASFWQWFLAALLPIGCLVGTAQAQAPAAPAAPAAAEEKEDETPKPKDIQLLTKDGVTLHATYFGSKNKKESVPVILLHQYKGSRGDWNKAALKLQQEANFAVIAPDLRGHGASTLQTLNGKSKKLDAATLAPLQFAAMVTQDLERIKAFLVEQNNAGKLNIDKLCVVGAEMGASVGMLWADLDWSWPALSTGKQGQDVKAVMMISPEVGFKTLNLAYLSTVAKTNISIYICVGNGLRPAVTDADRVNQLFRGFHQGKPEEDQDLFFNNKLDTKLQGTELVDEESMHLVERIAKFIELRAGSKPYAWALRGDPLGGAAPAPVPAAK